MNSLKQSLLTLCVIFSLFLSGCGFLSDSPVEGQNILDSDLGGSCKVDAESFTKILDEEISAEIQCLESSLRDFDKYVNRDDRTAISESDLKKFIARFFKSDASKIIQAVGIIFQINTLFLRDANSSISEDRISPLFQLLTVANKQAVRITNILRNYDDKKVDFWQTKQSLFSAISSLSGTIKSIINGAPNKVTEINIRKLLDDVIETMDDFDLTEGEKKVILLFKTFVAGGQRERFNSVELDTLLNKLPEIVELVFDFLEADKTHFGNDETKFNKHRASQVLAIRDLFFRSESKRVLFDENDLVELFKMVVAEPEKYNTEGIKEVSKAIKRHIIGDQSNSFTTEDTYKLIDILYVGMETFALNSSSISPVLEDNIPPSQLQKLKSTIEKESKLFTQVIIEHMTKFEFFPDKISLSTFISDLDKALQKARFDVDLEKIVAGSKLKKFAFGGSDKFTKAEFTRLVRFVPNYLSLMFNFLHFNNLEYEKESYKDLLLLETARNLETILPLTEDMNDSVMDLDVFVEVLDVLTGREFNIPKFQESVESLKSKVLKTPKDEFIYKDLKLISEYVLNLTGQNYYGISAFEHFESELRKDKKIKDLKQPDMGLKYLTDKEKSDYFRIFNIIIEQYLFYRNGEYITYDKVYKRTKKGTREALIFRWVLRKALIAYGESYGKGKDDYKITIDQLNVTLNDLKPLLIELELWSPNPETFARNTILLADLFMYQSNGTGDVQLEEATEYGSLILNSINATDKIESLIAKNCENVGTDDEPAYLVECYRKKFFDILFIDMKLDKYLPKLYRYVNDPVVSKTERDKFLESIELFARDFPDPTIPIVTRDIILVFGAILNIESTFVRFDKNDNNILDEKELKHAYYNTYKNIILELSSLDKFKKYLPDTVEKFGYSIFLYMIKTSTLPDGIGDILKVLKFHIFDKKDKIGGKRVNIADLLYFLVLNA